MMEKPLFKVRWGLTINFGKEVEEGFEDVYADDAVGAMDAASVPKGIDWVHAKLVR